MLVKVAELIGPALDWAVAKCEGFSLMYYYEQRIRLRKFLVPDKSQYTNKFLWELGYSTSWEQGGPLIDRELITVQPVVNPVGWMARNQKAGRVYEGQTALIAICRCYVASKLGDSVEVPEELL